ncbi:hypothetical protein D9613_004647 [Agrocybe pediades]|uniref:F-box domain-containing protein n=1 Tax=Agrocybe pediades TaxID=84607 RepID=A0A8H4VTQ7_9AGAR|nr:hypothetical protein D9613_004647 [Agrocybe pediades]
MTMFSIKPPSAMNVQSLNNDVLFMILYIATANEAHSMHGRLQTALSASHVCRSFRDILLNSPSIWGKLVYIDSQHGATSRSMVEEIVHRSGEAPLWIEASQTRDRSNSESSRTARRRLLLEILRRSWARVQRISVISDVGPYEINWRIYKIFLRPAPFLQVFKASIPLETEYLHEFEEDPTDIAQSLFSQAAPSLRTFGYDGFHLPKGAPWYSNITRFDTLAGTKLTRHLNTTLKILHLMPCLRYLRILANTEDGFNGWWKPKDEENAFIVTLPHLEYIELSRIEASRAQEFLNRVQPSPNGCLTNLRLNCNSWHDEILTNIIIPVLKTNMQFLYGSAPPRHLCLDIEALGLTIMDAGTCINLAGCTGKVLIDLDEGIFIDLDWRRHVRGYNLRRNIAHKAPYCDLPILSSFFSSSQLHRVTWLRVTHLYSPCAALLAPFRDVVVLEAHATAISGLMGAIRLCEKGQPLPRSDEEDSSEEEDSGQQEQEFDPENLFPHLQDLRITVGNDDFYSYGDDIHDFLQYRERFSKPIESVHLVDDSVEAKRGFGYICELVSRVEGVKLFINKDGVYRRHVYVPTKATVNDKDNDDATQDEEGSTAGDADIKDGGMDSDGAAEDANKGSTDA